MADLIINNEELVYRADEVDCIKQAKLVQGTNLKMKEAIREHNLDGISAPMVGNYIRMINIKFRDKIKCFVNPMIAEAEGFTLSTEECKALPGKRFMRPRNTKITVIYQTPMGKTETAKLAGKSAYVFQHQLDHLDGLLLSDVGLEIDENFDNAPKEERDEVISMYLESLDILLKKVEKEIEEDEELKAMSDAIDFMTKVQNGEVEVIIEKNKVKKESDENVVGDTGGTEETPTTENEDTSSKPKKRGSGRRRSPDSTPKQ